MFGDSKSYLKIRCRDTYQITLTAFPSHALRTGWKNTMMIPDSNEAFIKCCGGGAELQSSSQQVFPGGGKHSNPHRQTDVFLSLHNESLKMLLLFLDIHSIQICILYFVCASLLPLNYLFNTCVMNTFIHQIYFVPTGPRPCARCFGYSNE